MSGAGSKEYGLDQRTVTLLNKLSAERRSLMSRTKPTGGDGKKKSIRRASSATGSRIMMSGSSKSISSGDGGSSSTQGGTSRPSSARFADAASRAKAAGSRPQTSTGGFDARRTSRTGRASSASGSLSERGTDRGAPGSGATAGLSGIDLQGRSLNIGRNSKAGRDSLGRSDSTPAVMQPQQRPRKYVVGPVVITESHIPGVPLAYRSDAERQANPERLNLDRRNLTVLPFVENEPGLRLLNFQNNAISRIANLDGLSNLIFLDLYNNNITHISGLDHVPSIRVLMLGKNDIERIENIRHLSRMDVLDLHSNHIRVIENLDGLAELRVLNLAGNEIEEVQGLHNLVSLTELNLRRNKIKVVDGLGELLHLQRLFLSNNEISSLQDVGCLFESSSLSELALDGNPVAGSDIYRLFMIDRLPSLKHLDLKRVTETERLGAARANQEGKLDEAAAVRGHGDGYDDEEDGGVDTDGDGESDDDYDEEDEEEDEEDSEGESGDGSGSDDSGNDDDDGAEEAGWRRGKKSSSSSSYKARNNQAQASSSTRHKKHSRTKNNNSSNKGHNNSSTSHHGNAPTPIPPANKGRGPSYMGGRSGGRPATSAGEMRSSSTYNNNYGGTNANASSSGKAATGAASSSSDASLPVSDKLLRGITKGFLEPDTTNDRLCVYGWYNEPVESKHMNVSSVILRMMPPERLGLFCVKLKKLPYLTELVLSHNNITRVHELNALAVLTHLKDLVIEDNPVNETPLLRPYVLYRLSSLRSLNGEAITSEDRRAAEAAFGKLHNVALSSFPSVTQIRNPAFLPVMGKHVTSFTYDQYYINEKGSQNKSKDSTKRVEEQARQYTTNVISHAMLIDEKVKELNRVWPATVHDVVCECLDDMKDMDAYVRGCLQDV